MPKSTEKSDDKSDDKANKSENSKSSKLDSVNEKKEPHKEVDSNQSLCSNNDQPVIKHEIVTTVTTTTIVPSQPPIPEEQHKKDKQAMKPDDCWCFNIECSPKPPWEPNTMMLLNSQGVRVRLMHVGIDASQALSMSSDVQLVTYATNFCFCEGEVRKHVNLRIGVLDEIPIVCQSRIHTIELGDYDAKVFIGPGCTVVTPTPVPFTKRYPITEEEKRTFAAVKCAYVVTAERPDQIRLKIQPIKNEVPRTPLKVYVTGRSLIMIDGANYELHADMSVQSKLTHEMGADCKCTIS